MYIIRDALGFKRGNNMVFVNLEQAVEYGPEFVHMDPFHADEFPFVVEDQVSGETAFAWYLPKE